MLEIKAITSLNGPLNAVLIAELTAGNTISTSWRGGWPNENVTAIVLAQPFLTPIRHNLPEVTFHNINDPHYWKAEYYDSRHNEMLICNFGDIPDFSEM